MDLRSPYPFWLLKHGIIETYPSVKKDMRTDIVILGSGISGALVANELCEAGFQVMIVDRRHAATGSTAASTALLQYEIDTPLHKLAEKVGDNHANRSYQLCLDAIYELENICKRLSTEDHLFSRKPSLQFASFNSHVKALEKEFKARKKMGIRVQWMDQLELNQVFGIKKPAGLFSNAGAEADAYRITHALLKKCASKGAKVFDNTDVKHIQHHRKHVELFTSDGFTIRAKKLVIACGYESQQYIPYKIQDLHSTFAIVSEPQPGLKLWYRNALIWETAQPYIYLRATNDSRILMGGKDTPVTTPGLRDAMLTRKARDLERSFKKLFPKIPFKTDFKWCGNFASTKDGLPYIGSIRQRPHTYFALGFGGNGITFSVLAARMIHEMLAGRKHSDHDIFRFDR